MFPSQLSHARLVPITVAALVVVGVSGLIALTAPGRGLMEVPELAVARVTSFDVSIPCGGELEAAEQVEIRNPLDEKAVIVEVVDEGTHVATGDLLLRFADDELRTRIRDADDRVRAAEAALVAATTSLQIERSTRDSTLANARLEVQLAELALDAWRRGELIARRERLATKIETARINSERLIEKLEQSATLLDEGFMSRDEYERDRLAAIEASARLTQARLDARAFEKYERPRAEATLESAVSSARDEVARDEIRFAARLRTAAAELDSAAHQLSSRRQRLEELERQHEACVVRASAPGLVVYQSSFASRNWEGTLQPPQPGTELWPNELVLLLPDLSQMVAVVTVNESFHRLVAPGQRAMVYPDAMPGAVYEAEVIEVGVLARSGGWRAPTRRDYPVRLAIRSTAEGLRPSMRCRATIVVETVQNALCVPVQSVFESNGRSVVYVQRGDAISMRAVEVGRCSEHVIEILDGLREGERVLTREPSPRS